jgi:hypothetical protein
MKPRDPIIGGLHRVREDIGKVHHFDIHRIAAAIRQHEYEHPDGVVRESPNERRDRRRPRSRVTPHA